ncbi:MAG: tetratricopeptide repeat protein [Vicinamibacterales bacterium]
MTLRPFAAILLSLVAGLAMPLTASAQESERVLVMPFEIARGDQRFLWLSEAAAMVLGDDLNALGAEAISRDERRAAFDRLQVPPAAALTDATVIRLGQLLGASHVILGRLAIDGEDLIVEARSLALDVARIHRTASGRGPVMNLYATLEPVARALGPPSERSTEEIEAQHPPLDAFEQYIKGLMAETPAIAVQYLNAAIVAYPEYARPRLALWDIHTDQGAHERALAAVRSVPGNSPWATRAAFLAGVSYLTLNRYDDAFRTMSELAAGNPAPDILNNLGVVQLRRAGASGDATYYFTRAADLDPDDADYCFNLGYAYWRAGNPSAAIYWLRETVRRNPVDADAHFVLSVALGAEGGRAEANRERDLARRLSSTYATWEPPPGGDAVPKGLERLKSNVELPAARRLDDTLAAAGQREQQELATFHLHQAARFFLEERDREALEALDRVLFLSPYEAEAHVLVARIHLRAGRLPEAIDALKISLWSAVTAEAHALLAEAYFRSGDASAARAEAERALALDPGSAPARAVLDQIAAGPSTP